MYVIDIQVVKKRAYSPTDRIVCGNSDYKVHFHFDEEWAEHDLKTARFVWNGQYVDVVFTGDVCDVPVISNAKMCAIGVFAGDLRTTTPAMIPCSKSILCGSESPAEPSEDVYAQLMQIFNEASDSALVSAKAAEASRQAAEEQAEKAEAGMARAPYPDETTGTWQVWDYTEGAFRDTGVSAKGEKGDTGSQGAPGADGKDYILTDADKQEIASLVEASGGGTLPCPLPVESLPKSVPWVEEGEIAEILPECQPTFDADEGCFVVESPTLIEVGKTYTVNWNGMKYPCTGLDLSEIVAPGAAGLGNGTIVGLTGNDEPFFVVSGAAPGWLVILSLHGPIDLTISISCNDVVVNKLDNRCLDLDWLPVRKEVQIAAQKTVTNGVSMPTETKYGFPDLTSDDVYAGQPIVVYFDGARYETVVFRFTIDSADDSLGAGNLKSFGSIAGDPTMPFGLQFVRTRTNVICSEGEHTASVYSYDTYNKLPEAFLPDNLPSGSVELDTTLTKAGQAADAEAVGNAIIQLSNGKLDKTSLPTVVNDALAQAKASGEFDGPKGEPGEDYILTDADKSELVNNVLAALPTWTGGAY